MSEPSDFRDGQPVTPVASREPFEIRVCADRCTTCILRPGNLMNLIPGRLAQLVQEALERESHIVRHRTFDTGRGAICRGFADHPDANHRSHALRIGAALGILTEIDPP
ncbi:hypothetical protein [Nocardia asiatica]|uniref:hypothetical protein n=1 Tax=Nocardia asiatica TaxID=209252 RepID=UPI00030568E0|nr:hypothetical protein [Nocardia asiatica]